ncbi:hypothetical protein AWW73_18095 [Acinetobacter lactucae]|jgi:hypothetical protein|nr:hypothetical protein AWW73_18095 [Acinetobacter lactucae]
MTKGQIVQRLFIRFLIRNEFQNCLFQDIWNAFIEKCDYLNSEQNFYFIYDYFQKLLKEDYFIMDNSSTPPKYTSLYTTHQLKKLLLPEELQSPYETIFIKEKNIRSTIHKNQIEIECLRECFKEFPPIRFQIEFLIQQKQQELLTLESRANALTELIETFK